MWVSGKISSSDPELSLVSMFTEKYISMVLEITAKHHGMQTQNLYYYYIAVARSQELRRCYVPKPPAVKRIQRLKLVSINISPLCF